MKNATLTLFLMGTLALAGCDACNTSPSAEIDTEDKEVIEQLIDTEKTEQELKETVTEQVEAIEGATDEEVEAIKEAVEEEVKRQEEEIASSDFADFASNPEDLIEYFSTMVNEAKEDCKTEKLFDELTKCSDDLMVKLLMKKHPDLSDKLDAVYEDAFKVKADCADK